jgi:hypothetical protein
MMATTHRAEAGGLPPSLPANAASISGQSIPRGIGAPAGEYGIVPGGAERAEVRLARTMVMDILSRHDADDDARAGRGGRDGWRAPDERRHLVPWAQETERIGVPAPHHGGVQDEAKHAMSAMSPLKSCDVEKPQPQR